VGTIDGLDDLDQRKVLFLPGFEPVQPVANIIPDLKLRTLELKIQPCIK